VIVADGGEGLLGRADVVDGVEEEEGEAFAVALIEEEEVAIAIGLAGGGNGVLFDTAAEFFDVGGIDGLGDNTGAHAHLEPPQS
jgi:hypothetical protein